jgi:hypothetical protein
LKRFIEIKNSLTKNKKHKDHSVVDLARDLAGAPYFTGELAGAPLPETS